MRLYHYYILSAGTCTRTSTSWMQAYTVMFFLVLAFENRKEIKYQVSITSTLIAVSLLATIKNTTLLVVANSN